MIQFLVLSLEIYQENYGQWKMLTTLGLQFDIMIEIFDL